jgi:transposase
MYHGQTGRVFRSSTRIWAELHEKAFRRLGGAPRILVLDNLREGVLVPDVYDATLNPLYRDVLAHYGAVALPCRIQDPDLWTSRLRVAMHQG